MIERRSFLKGFAALLVAPAIVRIENIMPVRALLPEALFELFVDPEGKVVHSITINRRGFYLWRANRREHYLVGLDGHRLFEIGITDPHIYSPNEESWMTGSVVRKADGTLDLTRNVSGTFLRPDGTLYHKRNGVISEIGLPPPPSDECCIDEASLDLWDS